MNRTSFNDDWRVRPKANPFAEFFGGGAPPSQTVRMPHDAMLGGARDPNGHWGTGFFPGGIWEHEKTLTASEDLLGKRVLLEFEGALAVIRPTGAGTITVTVSADGCDDRTVTIEAVHP